MSRRSGRGTARASSSSKKKWLPKCWYGAECHDGSKKHIDSFWHPLVEEQEYGNAAADYDSDEMSQQSRWGVQDYEEQWEETGWLVSIKNVLKTNIAESSWNRDTSDFELEAQSLALEVIEDYLNNIERGSKHWISFEDYMIDFNKALNKKIKSKRYDDKQYYNSLKIMAGAVTTGIAVYYLYGIHATDVSASYFTCALGTIGISATCSPKDLIGWALWKFKNNMESILLTATGAAIVADRIRNTLQYLKDVKNYVSVLFDGLLGRGNPLDYHDIISAVSDEMLPETEDEEAEEEDDREECIFGDACYNTRWKHREQFKHPDGEGARYKQKKMKKKKCNTKKCKKRMKLRETIRRKIEKRKKRKGKTKRKNE